MYEKLKKEIVDALKEKNTLKLQTLRGVKGDIDLQHINKKIEIDDALVIDVLSHQIKSRKESIIEFQKGNREDLVNKTNEEIELLQEYLPKQLSVDEIKGIINDAFLEINPTSMKDMGLIMKNVTPKLKGKADMAIVSEIIKERLSNL